MSYVTLAEANAYLWTSGEDTLVTNLITSASKIIDAFCCVPWFNEVEETIHLQYQSNWNYLFKRPNVTEISKINGVNVAQWINTDYIIQKGRRLSFKSSYSIDADDFGRVEFIITYWYATIPDAIKQACFMIIQALYTSKWSTGLSSYSQGDFSLNMADGWVFGSETDKYKEVRMLLNPYKLVNVVS